VPVSCYQICDGMLALRLHQCYLPGAIAPGCYQQGLSHMICIREHTGSMITTSLQHLALRHAAVVCPPATVCPASCGKWCM
jgi:hypothetical protein